MNPRSDRARKAATAEAFLNNRNRQRALASKSDMTLRIEVGNEQIESEKSMRDQDKKFVTHMLKFYPHLYKGD